MTSAVRQARRIRNSGYATVAQRQMARARQRVADAPDAVAQLDAIWDWFRLAASRMAPAARADILHRCSLTLADLAAEAEKARDTRDEIRNTRKASR